MKDRFELVAVVGPERCQICRAELVSEARFTEGALSLAEIGFRVLRPRPWIEIGLQAGSRFFVCPLCEGGIAGAGRGHD